MLAITIPDDVTALTCTSDFRSEALTTSNHSGIIIDSGTSRHFSPDRSKFLNYKEFSNHKPIRAADRRTFHALGKGDIQITLPNGMDTHHTQRGLLLTYNGLHPHISILC